MVLLLCLNSFIEVLWTENKMHIFKVCSFISLYIYIYIDILKPSVKSRQWSYSPFPKVSSVLFFQTKVHHLCFSFKGVWRKQLPFKLGPFHPFWRGKYVHNLTYSFKLCQVRFCFPFLFYQNSPRASLPQDRMFTTDMNYLRILSREESGLGFLWESRMVLEDMTALSSLRPTGVTLGVLDEPNDKKPNRVFSPTVKF